FRRRLTGLEGLEAYSALTGFSLAGRGVPERVEGAQVSAGLFRLLGVSPALGRGFVEGEDQPGRDAVVVLSHGLWRQRFGGARDVLGRTVEVDGVARTVVGVMPPGFRFPAAGARLWVPVPLDGSNPGDYWAGAPVLSLVGRVRDGVPVERIGAEVRAAAPEVRAAFPWPLPPTWTEGAGAAPLREVVVGDAGTPLLVLVGAVGLVLLIACANVANLLLVRNASRRKELAVRAALGATRGHLARFLFTESLLLSLMGTLLGLALALAGMRALLALLPAGTPRVAEIGIDGRVLAGVLLLSLLNALLFGVVPSLQASRADLGGALRDGGKGSRGVAHRRLSSALVVGEIALAVTLVIGAGLLVRSLWELLRVDTGLRAEQVVAARLSPPPARYTEPERTLAFYQSVLSRVQGLPGVQAAAVVQRVPLGGEDGGVPLAVEGQPLPAGAAAPFAGEWRVTPDYLRVMGIPLLRGRALTDADRQGAPAVALVNQAMARRFWPGQDPVGRRIKPVWWQEWITVVGVVGDVKDGGLQEESGLQLYRPVAQGPSTSMHLVVRTRAAPEALAAPVAQEVWAVDPDVPVSDVRTMREVVAASVAGPRSAMTLLGLFAGIALVLGAIGVYGVIAYAVSRRTQEFGIRMAMGASRGAVVGLVLRQGGRLAAAGVGAGLLAALVLTRVLASLLFGVSAADPLTFGVVALLVLGLALLASYVPAWRATRIEP
ncbi:MAG: ABC transporter permease, partial [Gemmatimonadetes bacterium]|nr:ABC transporter permease [Gemmatimonadota bacterium]